jgi:hypothetical protein
LKLFGRRQAADKAEESTEVIGLRTDLQPATREAAPEQSLTLKQAVEPIREELLRMTEVFRNLASKLSGHAGSEQHQITDLGTESDAAIQQLLRQINRAMDGLRSMAVESPEEIATREVLLDDLDASWTRCNAFACQLMMLSFDEDSAGAAVEQLAAVIGQAEDACRQYHGTLGSALRALG